MTKQTNTSASESKSSALTKFAYLSAIIGGGVAGADCAAWFGVSPAIGAVVSSVVSGLLTHFLFELKKNHEEIEKTFMKIGGVGGIIFGIYIGIIAAEPDSFWSSVFMGGIIFGIIGTLIGKTVAWILLFAVVFLLFISRGPVGFFLRSLISEQASSTTINDSAAIGVGAISETFMAIISSVGSWFA